MVNAATAAATRAGLPMALGLLFLASWGGLLGVIAIRGYSIYG